MLTGKCPACSKVMQELIAEAITISVPGKRAKYKGVNYLCPSCHTVLSSGFDPVALKADVIAQLAKKLSR